MSDVRPATDAEVEQLREWVKNGESLSPTNCTYLLARLDAERRRADALREALRPFVEDDATKWADLNEELYPIDVTVLAGQWQYARRLLEDNP